MFFNSIFLREFVDKIKSNSVSSKKQWFSAYHEVFIFIKLQTFRNHSAKTILSALCYIIQVEKLKIQHFDEKFLINISSLDPRRF